MLDCGRAEARGKRMDPVLKQGKLVWPGLAGLLCIVLAILPDRWTASLPIQPLVQALSKVPSISWLELIYDDGRMEYALLRIALSISAVILLVYAGIRDYSAFFPQRFKIKVYFDNEGLTEVLQGFDSRQLAKLNLCKDWQAAKETYFTNLNSKLANAGFAFRFSSLDGSTSGNGKGEIKGRLVARWGLQKYKIVDGSGDMMFVTPVSNKDPLQLITKYKLSDSRANELEVALLDIYRMRPIVIMPEFIQMIHRTAEAKGEFDHVLCTATRITFLPIIDIGTTVYLQKQADGTRVPIGYAIYEPEA
jgi:hypothetical protein